MTTPLKLGRRQRTMLAQMSWFGNGGYPQRWRFGYIDGKVMASLYRYALVTSDQRTARLTPQGERLVRERDLTGTLRRLREHPI